jgi:hypothetical protein
MQKISVVAPIALSEKLDPAKTWRQSVNVHSRRRLQLVLKSFLQRFDQGAVETFLAVCPDREYDRVRELVEEPTAGRVSVVNESHFFEMCGLDGAALGGWSGWQIQQIVKLGFAKISKTRFYLTLDSDIVQFRPAGVSDLFPDGERALAGVESAADYDRLYTGEFSAQEQAAKKRYYEASQYILGYERPASRAGLYFSETPVVMNRGAAIEMVDHIEALHGRGIVDVLHECPGWTEYSLYFQFLEMSGYLWKLYTCGGSNAVLSLEKSVWQPTPCYKSQRLYDRLHFASSPLVEEGPFLAIQSWIPVREWLPAKFRGPADFYQQLEAWLDGSAAPPQDTVTPSEAAPTAALDAVNPAAFLRILESVPPSSALFKRTRELLDGSLEVSPVLKATPPGEAKFLTIGMTTHNDYDGCYFTLQAIRLYHPEILSDVEFLVIDNDPAGPCATALKALENFVGNFRYIPYRSRQGTAVRDLIFREALGEFVLCIDCHVFFPAGALARLIEYCRRNPESSDLLQGPLLSDAFDPLATHFDPKWSHGMYGCWGMDERGDDPGSAPFEIGMQGLGVFACRREKWPGFNPRLAGFGGEEGYLHEKIRRGGGRNLCLPFLRWMHRFQRPTGVPYRVDWTDRIRNYLLIYDELGLDPAPVIDHFEEFLGKEKVREMVWAAQAELAGPFHFFDAIYCINLDKQADRWKAMQQRFRKLGIARAVRRFAAAETPLNHHIGCALSHRRIIAEARQQQLQTVLVFEDDAQFSPDAAEVLGRSLRELEGREWQLLYLGGYRTASLLESVPECPHLRIPGWISCTHAIAYHRSVYDAILEAVPDNAVDIALWLRTNVAIDKFYNQTLGASSYLTWPVIASQWSIMEEEVSEFED